MVRLNLLVFIAICLKGALGSGKKGLAVAPENYRCGDLDHFTNVHWWYDWGKTPSYHEKLHCGNLKSGRVPMIWSWSSDLNIHPDSQYILGFNEPNFYHQSNMTPQVAAQHWRQLEQHFPGKLLVSPAAAPCGSHEQCMSNGEEWFAQFFQHCQGCRVDFLATHGYWCSADTTMHYLQGLWDRFHKPIWLTEFSCPQTHSEDTQLRYMKEILPRLEAAHFVSHYSWFVHRFKSDGWIYSSTSLVHQDSSALTTLGEFYNNF
ncbi:hypothetical protein ACJMK2_006371 [Sinanodonta woodiana]|uniref:Asl1-like glycosyl hydrolase catalytic domain-containing protein n=1 Tax=Sinanodonta woodiana TaxID=1069815 RepID=A0ABD3VSY6_SINWO